jgi:putative cell wall-binding protein
VAPATAQVVIDTGLPSLDYVRYRGADRYETAARISRDRYPGGATQVILASGENWPDALSAGVLARLMHAPLLLTQRAQLPQATADELTRLHPASVLIVGGMPSVSAGVASLVAETATVDRIAGIDRYETAALIADQVRMLEGSVPSATAVLASGENYPDALSAAPMAAAAGWPILLTRSGALPASTHRALADAGIAHTLVVGGDTVVTPDVTLLLPDPVRLAGKDRYATSRAIADHAVSAGVLTSGELGMATGRAFPDALAGATLLADHRGALVLSDGETPAFDTWLAGIGTAAGRLDVFGGEPSVPEALALHTLGTLRPPVR